MGTLSRLFLALSLRRVGRELFASADRIRVAGIDNYFVAGSLRSMSFRRLFFVPVPVSTLGRARVGSFGYWRASLTGPLTG